MAGNYTNSKYIEMIREVRVTNIHVSLADRNAKALDNFCHVLENMGYSGRDICTRPFDYMWVIDIRICTLDVMRWDDSNDLNYLYFINMLVINMFEHLI